jgi:DNA-binding response OmpR family regulator
MRILVVEDDLDFSEALLDHLVRLGHEVKVASNAPQALALVDTFAPDVVFIDIALPIFDGNAVAAGVRDQSTSHPPLVALTSVIDTADGQLFDARIAKPATLADVSRVLSAVLFRFDPASAGREIDEFEDTYT